MKNRIDALLAKLKFRGQPLNLDRLHWWFIICLTRIFGREVDMGNGETERILPIVWGKKIRLLGAQWRVLEATFSSEYTLRLRTRPVIKLSPGDVVPPASSASPPSAVHLVLGHLPAGPMDRILDYVQQQAGTARVVLAYGGKRANFEQIRFPRKIFIADPRLRGHSYQLSYFNLMAEARAFLAQAGLDPEWIFLADYDFLPLQPDYLEGLIALMKAHGAGLGGKQFMDVSLTNKLFLTQAVNAGLFERRDALNGSGRKAVYHCLGCAFLVHRDCYDAILKEKTDLEDLYFELALPTAAALHNYRLLSFDEVSPCFQHVRYRPVVSAADALSRAEAGAQFVHPLKESEAFISAWAARGAAKITN